MFNSSISQNRIRRITMALTWLAVIALLASGCGAQKPQVYRVGILSGLSVQADIVDGFKAKMTELGYVEGENVTYDVQSTDFDMAKYKSVLEKFVADEVDLIVAFPTEAALEAKAATAGTDIPVVFVLAVVEGTDLIDSVREPGGNITGVRMPAPDMLSKRFEVLLEMVPDAKRIWIPYQQGYPTVPAQLEVLRPAAEAAGVTLIEAPANDAAGLEADLQGRVQGTDPGIDAILFVTDPLASRSDSFVVMGKFSYEHRVPIGGLVMTAGDYSSIFGVTVDNVEAGKQAALLADKALRGIQAGTIPVMSAEMILKIDYRTASEFGLTVPDGLLRQASEVIR